MKKNYTLRAVLCATALLMGGVSAYADYCTYDGTNSNPSRYLNSLTVKAGDQTLLITGNFGKDAALYQNYTAQELKVKAGTTVSTEISYTGATGTYSGSLYIDYDNNTTFDYEVSDGVYGNELVTYSNVKSMNSDGTQSSGLGSTLPDFTLRGDLATGKYRARLIIDPYFHRVDPCGEPKGQYKFNEYGGIILDFTLDVEADPNAIDEIESIKANVYGADGKIVIESEEAVTASIYTVNGAAVKTVSVLGIKTIELPAAMYIVNVDGKAKLVVVK